MPAADGKSAPLLKLLVEHINMTGFSPLIQMRQTFQFVKAGDNWKIDFISWGFIVGNDDVEKLNGALE